MREIRLEIGDYANCCLTRTEYDGDLKPDITLDYLEHATDHMSSDTETSVDIDKESALEIISFLRESFNIVYL